MDRHLAWQRDKPVAADLFIPFLDRSLELLATDGRCGFICSDRWRFMAFAEAFRTKWLPRLKIVQQETFLAADAFLRDIDSYPHVLVAVKRETKTKLIAAPAVTKSKTLTELGCSVKVGPALGCTPAFVLEPGEDDVETELLWPWVDGTDVQEGAVIFAGRRVVAMYGDDGKLVNLDCFPFLKSRLERYQEKLKAQSIVRAGAPWFRPIDRVRVCDWKRPKLLVPEIAKVPRLAIDRAGMIPSHGVYAIFAPGDDVDGLYDRLCGGKLAGALNGIAPRVKGGYVRCYRRFLLEIPI
ncbi:MAG TPA: hypothetical protein VEV37_12660 [Bryobacteraceae bacterium]|nr:hypothetical protein [Bryobacteraceae bacterium]